MYPNLDIARSKLLSPIKKMCLDLFSEDKDDKKAEFNNCFMIHSK